MLTEDIDSDLNFPCFAAAPHHMLTKLCISICRSITWNLMETHLLTAVCGDSQAIRNQTCCLMFLHQPHGRNRNGHLRGKRKWQKKRKKFLVSKCVFNYEFLHTTFFHSRMETGPAESNY